MQSHRYIWIMGHRELCERKPRMTVHIRKYRPTDIDAVVSAWEAASRLAHAFLPEAFLRQEKKNLREIYMPNSNSWVAELEQTVVGFLSMHGNEVGGLFLHPDYHGHGIGRALMDKARETHNDLVLEVFEENTIGRKFYDRYGFKLVEKKIFEQTGHTLLRLKYTAEEVNV